MVDCSNGCQQLSRFAWKSEIVPVSMALRFQWHSHHECTELETLCTSVCGMISVLYDADVYDRSSLRQ